VSVSAKLDEVMTGNLFQYWKLRRTINGTVDYCPFSNTYYSYSAVLYDEEEGLGFKPLPICFFPNR